MRIKAVLFAESGPMVHMHLLELKLVNLAIGIVDLARPVLFVGLDGEFTDLLDDFLESESDEVVVGVDLLGDQSVFFEEGVDDAPAVFLLYRLAAEVLFLLFFHFDFRLHL